MEAAHDKTFGPLAATMAFGTEAEVVELVIATKYGLSGCIEHGMLGVNTTLISTESPYGGVKESELARGGSQYGLAEDQDIKSLTMGSFWFQLRVTPPT
ncbi:succinate semialdehyde dehydrogenase [Colletotrichum eremochloae]|nr:succinate semialdehyde dehydrogenase [Colletotrichum eremochloae]